jgi:hypothetical protein
MLPHIWLSSDGKIKRWADMPTSYVRNVATKLERLLRAECVRTRKSFERLMTDNTYGWSRLRAPALYLRAAREELERRTA